MSILGIRVKKNADQLSIGKGLDLHTPEGKIKKLKIQKILNSSGEEKLSVSNHQIIYLNHVSGVSIKSAVYFQDEGCEPSRELSSQ